VALARNGGYAHLGEEEEEAIEIALCFIFLVLFMRLMTRN
jgi:hypothetical protein